MASDMPAGRLSLFALLGIIGVAGFAALSTHSSNEQPSVNVLHGEVHDAHGPIEGALVRWKGEALAARTDILGAFQLPQRGPLSSRITAWKPGHFIAGADAARTPLILDLRPLPTEDCEAYAWIDPTPNRAAKDNCGNCHGAIYREWAASGHAHSATNRHFLSLYDGTDWHGKPGVGWSLRAEHPDGVGVCTACHAPTVSHGDPAYFDLSQAQGVARQGVHCDYCHKITDAGLGSIGLTHGRFGLQLLRPAEGQLFFGPLDDVDRGEDAYSPLYKDSKYCASCHEGTVFGVHVYSTYSEWLDSPARKEGKQCQTCHMQPTGTMTNIAPGRGGIERDPKTLANHRFFAGSQLDMLRRALTVTVTTIQDGIDRRVIVEVRADGVGHRVPTGFVDRHLVLIVEWLDGDGQQVEARSGPQLPRYAGPGLSGLSGRIYGKILHDDDAPVPFWRADDGKTEDTRLTPGQADRITFRVTADVQRVRLRLLYRRTWPEVAAAKAWPDNESMIVERLVELR